jgi:hypothetical protein
MATNIYVLNLEHDKWYIGKTNNVNQRVDQHKRGEGSLWTKLHPVRSLVETIEGDSFDEDKTVKIYMSRYGVENVRGGSYSQVDLSKMQLLSLETELRGAQDACFKCGEKGHFATKCIMRCARCGRNSHTIDKCYAKTHFNGSLLSDSCENESSSDESSSDNKKSDLSLKGSSVMKQISSFFSGYFW